MSRERWVVSLVGLGGIAASALFFRSPGSAAGGAFDAVREAQIARGLAIAPVPLDLRGKDPALVGLGSYIVNAVSACNDCHTEPAYEPGHDPFRGGDGRFNTAGYLKGGKELGKGIISRDLTPDERGLPGGMTLEQFANAMSAGQDSKHPGRILQVMPWPVYGHMLEGDERAVYEYLRAIPSSRARR